MEDSTLIEPSEFDLIVMGTGLQEGLLAGAAAQAGKTVLHLDAASSYGSHWASHRLDGLLALAAAQQQQPQLPLRRLSPTDSQPPAIADEAASAEGGGRGSGSGAEAAALDTGRQANGFDVPSDGAAVYSHVTLAQSRDADLGEAREYSIDLAPKAAFCAGSLVGILLACGAHNYLEFKALQASYMWTGGTLMSVPASRADIFAADGLALPQRRALTRFLSAAQSAMSGSGPLQDAFDSRPFAQLLAEQGLAPEVRALLLYAVAMLEADQEPAPAVEPATAGLAGRPLPPPARTPIPASVVRAAAAADAPAAESPDESSGGSGAERAAAAAAAAAAPHSDALGGGVATAAAGLTALRLYVESTGKYGPGTGAFLLPYYGAGELPQAFCRVAAVAGALYVLRCPVERVLTDPAMGIVTGVRTASGQTLRCGAFTGDVDAFAGVRVRQRGGSGSGIGSGSADRHEAIARAVAVTDAPLRQGGGGATLVVFPPRSLPSGNAAAVRVLQVGSSTAVAPPRRYLLYASTPGGAQPAATDTAPAGLADVWAALAALATLPPSAQRFRQDAGAAADGGGSGGAAAVAAAAEEGSGAESAAGDVADAAADGRPRALLVLSYLQSTAAPPEAALPPNAACSAPPDGSLDFRAALAAAEAAFRRLFPDAAAARGGTLFAAASDRSGGGGGGGAGDLDDGGITENGTGGPEQDSDDEALAALEAALAGFGEGRV